MDYNSQFDKKDLISMQQDNTPISPNTPPFGSPPFEPSGPPLSPETPPFGPPPFEPSGPPLSPETPPFGPPPFEPSGPPLSPETPPFGPPPFEPSGPPLSPETPPWSPPIILPQPPTFPDRPTGQLSTIRFLYAATGQPPVNISVGSRNIAANFQYSNITGYSTVPAGNTEVTIRNARNNSQVLNQTTLRLQNGGIYTIALINAPNGLVIYLIEDTACYKNLNDSCFRVINLSYQSPAVDILLGNGQMLFDSVRYMDITDYRQIRPGTYPLLAVESRNCNLPMYDVNRVVQVIPIVIGSNIRSCYGRILLSSLMPFERNRIYSVYMIGNAYGRPPLQFLLVENYLEY